MTEKKHSFWHKKASLDEGIRIALILPPQDRSFWDGKPMRKKQNEKTS